MDYLKNLAKDSKSTPTTTTAATANQIPDAFADDVAKLAGVSAEQVKTVGGKVVEQYAEKGRRLAQQGGDADDGELGEKVLSRTKQSGPAAATSGVVDAKNGGDDCCTTGKFDPASSSRTIGVQDDDDTPGTKTGSGGGKSGGRNGGDGDDDDNDLAQQAQKSTSRSGFVSGVKTRGMKNSQGQETSTTGDFQSQGGNISQDY